MARKILGETASLFGALVGGLIGVGLVYWLRRQGFYAMVLPGACLGLGGHVLAPTNSKIRGVILGLSGLLIGLLTEWKVFTPGDPTFLEFLKDFSKQPALTPIMIGAGAIMAFWFGRQRSQWVPQTVKPVQVKSRVEGQND